MIKILKEKFKIVFGERIKLKILNVLKKNPNLAIFAFDRIGADISVYGIFKKKYLAIIASKTRLE